MIYPVYCPEDPGGPLTKDKALALIELMRVRAMERINPAIDRHRTPEQESERHLNSCVASVEETTLLWVSEIIRRMTLDVSSINDALKATAEELEKQAAHLRSKIA